MNVRVKSRRTNSFEISSKREMVVKVCVWVEGGASVGQWVGGVVFGWRWKSVRGDRTFSLSKNWTDVKLSVESSVQTVRKYAGIFG